MLSTVEGIYRDGAIVVLEIPKNIVEETPVIVTFFQPGHVALAQRGIDAAQAAELRARLATFSEDWDQPKMDIYDHYESAKL